MVAHDGVTLRFELVEPGGSSDQSGVRLRCLPGLANRIAEHLVLVSLAMAIG